MDADVEKPSFTTAMETDTAKPTVGVSNFGFVDPLPSPIPRSNRVPLNSQSIVSSTPVPAKMTAGGKTGLMEKTVGHSDGGSETEVARYGWLCLTPNSLQRCRTVKWVLFWLCWASTVQGMVVNGFINSVITNIEKRFDLRSTDAGVIAGAYDIASVLCAIPVSYLGSRVGASKPRWLGWGMFILGLGSFVFAAPHFLAPNYNPSGSRDSVREILVCLKDTEVSEKCKMDAQNWMSKFRSVFILGQLINGIGSSPLYTLGTTFLDESVPMKMSSLYLGTFYAMGAIGPALGYVLGSVFLQIYVDAPYVDPAMHDISPSSDLWIGGWWIGFLLSGALSIIISIPIIAFPDKLPGHKSIQASRVSEAYSGVETSNSASASFGRLRDFPHEAKTLLKNPTFVALSLAGACEGILMTGFATFTPKFLETQFQVPAARASVLIGLVAVPAAGGGTFLGGWIVKKLKLSCAGIIRVCIILSSLCFLSYFTFTISCRNPKFAGANIAYDNRPIDIYDSNLTGICNAECKCNDTYDPVCGSNGVIYFSPCHAGCTTMDDDSQEYRDCACVNSMKIDEEFSYNSSNNGTAIRGNLDDCKEKCSHMTTFLIVFFIIMLITFVTGLPALAATLRCVPDDKRSLGLGLQWIIVRLLGTVPGPMIFGSLIDNTCTLWQNNCGRQGSCRMYDNPNMSKYMMGISLFGKLLSTILFIVAWKVYVPPSSKMISSMSCDTMTSTLTSVTESPTLTTINESESRESLESFNKSEIELT